MEIGNKNYKKSMQKKIRRRNTISELPDELLLKILSWLSPNDVMATSVLSKRWRSLWKEVTTCKYDEGTSRITMNMFKIFIRKRSVVESLQLRLYPYTQNAFFEPVDMAVNRYLRELRIEMVYSIFELPNSLYFTSQLETLILEKLTLVDVPRNARLTCLKRLHLLSVKFSRDESVKRLLSICPILEDLVVRRSSYTNVVMFTIDVPTLTKLSIDNSSGKSRPPGPHGFVVNAPSLMFFTIRDSFSNYLRFEHMPKLVKASVNVVCHQPDKFIGPLAPTHYLSLCFVTSQTPYPSTTTSFLFLDHLEFYSCSAELGNLLTRILNDSPRLRVLKLYHKQCVQSNNVMAPWNRPDSVPECLSSHLEIFEWRQYNGTEQEREAAKYILANASRLRKAIFYSDSIEKQEMLKELECVARGSKTCRLVPYNYLTLDSLFCSCFNLPEVVM